MAKGHKIGKIAKIKKSSTCIAQRSPHTPSFIEIALAVTKRALLMDDDRCHVIAITEES
jgi:hypothetical protein